MNAATVTKRRPIRGAIYGLILGIGLALIVVGRKVVTLDSVVPLMLVVLGVVVGVAFGLFGPARKPRGPAPRSSREEEAAAEPEPEPEPESEPEHESKPTSDAASAPDVGDDAVGGSERPEG